MGTEDSISTNGENVTCQTVSRTEATSVTINQHLPVARNNKVSTRARAVKGRVCSRPGCWWGGWWSLLMTWDGVTGGNIITGHHLSPSSSKSGSPPVLEMSLLHCQWRKLSENIWFLPKSVILKFNSSRVSPRVWMTACLCLKSPRASWDSAQHVNLILQGLNKTHVLLLLLLLRSENIFLISSWQTELHEPIFYKEVYLVKQKNP